MAINSDKPHLWKADVERSIDIFLCGYFEPGYLGYEAAEGSDWIWEHRLADLDILLSEHEKPPYQVSDALPTYEQFSNVKEMQRFALQRETDSKRTQALRNQMGQFSTPFLLARDIVAYSLDQFEAASNQTIQFLEPALGTGVFFSALESQERRFTVELATGVEIDDGYARVAANLWSARPFEVAYFDFAEFSALPEKQGAYSLLCTNPPYVS